MKGNCYMEGVFNSHHVMIKQFRNSIHIISKFKQLSDFADFYILFNFI